jgi:hypothetical protein
LVVYQNKNEKQKILLLETVPNSNRKIVERKQIDSPIDKYMTAHFLGLVQALQ